MSDYQIQKTADGWDIVIDDGDLVWISDVSRVAEVAQRVVYRLQTWLGESPFDRLVGVPYETAIFGFEPIPGAVALLTQEIVETEGVDGLVLQPTFVLSSDRTLTVSAVIRVGDEEAAISLEVAAV